MPPALTRPAAPLLSSVLLGAAAAIPVFSTPTTAPAADREPVVAPRPVERLFRDAALTAAVREELHLADDAELKPEDLRNVYFLRAPDAGVKRLDGLENCPNVALIDLSGNAIADVAPLAGLGALQSLDLAGNRIESLEPLAGLENLQYLKLDGNQVADLAPLAKLERLAALYLPDNLVTDLAPLSGLKSLTSLDAAGNGVTDAGPLAGCERLSAVTLSRNGLSDVAPLAKLTELRFLILRENEIADLAPLAAAATADAAGPRSFAPYLQLYLEGNPLSDAARGGQLDALRAAGVRAFLDESPDGDESSNGSADE